MNIEQSLDKFFKTYKKEIDIYSLISMFKVQTKDYVLLLTALYNLEKQGKIYGNENGKYIHISKEYYLSLGTINVSTKNNYYINLKKGNIIIIKPKDLNGAVAGDTVFVETQKSKKSTHQLIGKVVRVVKMPKLKEKTFLYKTKICRNYTKNYYYAKYDDQIIFILNSDLNGAYENDLVTLSINNHTCNGKVVEILKRHKETHIFEYKKINNSLIWSPIGNSNFKVDISFKKNIDFQPGDRIVAKVLSNNQVEYVRKIDNDGLRFDLKSLMYNAGYEMDFSKEVTRELESINGNITNKDLLNRMDLRCLDTVTIDGSSAKDLDDAISLKLLDSGYRLYVHIADVSHYVKFGGHIYDEAYKRGNSIYPANTVIPMLGKKLSNNICSLNPNEDKLTKTFMIDFDLNGDITNYSIFRSIINSNCKMTYSKVNHVLSGVEVDEYTPYLNILKNMENLSNLLEKVKRERGFIYLKEKTLKFDISNNKYIINEEEQFRGKAQLIIENFMLIANQVTAEFMYNLQLPFIYRCHEGPDIDRISKLKYNLKKLEYSINNLNSINDPRVLQKVLLSIFKGKDDEEITFLSKIFLESMTRAYFSACDDIGHYGLALKHYGTISSPIRKFSDLNNHYSIDAMIDGDLNKFDIYKNKFSQIARQCTEKQYESEKFEQRVDCLLLKNYLDQFANQEFNAIIVFIRGNKVFIKTSNSLYGFITVYNSSISDNSVKLNGNVHKIGDSIKVKVSKFDEKSGDISFDVVKSDLNKIKIKKKKRRNDIYD